MLNELRYFLYEFGKVLEDAIIRLGLIAREKHPHLGEWEWSVDDAGELSGKGCRYDEGDMRWQMWTQTTPFPDSPRFTDVVVCTCDITGASVVYFGGRHAYTIRRPNEVFEFHLKERRLPDAEQYRKRAGTVSDFNELVDV